jgi:neutral ceramidase
VVMAPNPAGPVLPWVDVLAVEGAEGKRAAVLFAHAAHPVVVHAASTLISADYPGAAVRALKTSHGADPVFLFAQGCGGDINAFPLQGGTDAAAAVGRDLAAAVGRALDAEGGGVPAGPIRVATAEAAQSLQPPPPPEKLKQQLADERNPERRERFAALLKIAEEGKPRSVRCPVTGFAVGDALCVLGLPHDTFSEYARFAGEKSPFGRTVVLGYTNGLECYLATKAGYELGERGGYEASPRGAAFLFESRTPPAPSAEERAKAAVTEVLRKLKGA